MITTASTGELLARPYMSSRLRQQDAARSLFCVCQTVTCQRLW